MKKLLILFILFIFLLLPEFVAAVPCNISISIEYKIQDSGKIEFYNRLSNSSFDYTIEYWIEDIDENIIKKKINTTNQNKKTFTPKNTNKTITIKNKIAKIECININVDNNYAQKTIYFQDSGRVGINYTHKTVKLSFEINKELEKLSEFSNSINVKGKNSNNFSLNLPSKPKNTQAPKKQQSYNNDGEENKLRKVLPHFLIALTTLISVVLIWRR